MGNAEFWIGFTVLLLAAIASQITRVKWQREDDKIQAAFDEEEAAKQRRHEEPSWHGPALNKHLWLMRLLCWVFTIAVFALGAARIVGKV